MHKLVNRIAFIVIILFAGLYFVQGKINSPEECKKIAGIWNEAQQTCEQTTEQMIYEHLSAGYPITMTYPETDFELKLDKSETVEGSHFLRGHYQNVIKEATDDEEAIYDRGLLYLNMSKMVILNEIPGGVVNYAAPFIINTVGTGVFIYVGLFTYDMKTKQSTHLTSVYLGDRVREEKITHIEDYLQIDFKSHSQEQASTDYPTVDDALYLQLSDDLLTVTEVKRMHSSWDKNNDGINDCEGDGSCDDSIDYALPRITL